MTADLVERAQRGDHAAFDALATAAYSRLYAIAARILRDPYAAEDAVQDALVRAWRDLRAVRDPERFDAWLHRLLVHACADEGRKAKEKGDHPAWRQRIRGLKPTSTVGAWLRHAGADGAPTLLVPVA